MIKFKIILKILQKNFDFESLANKKRECKATNSYLIFPLLIIAKFDCLKILYKFFDFYKFYSYSNYS